MSRTTPGTAPRSWRRAAPHSSSATSLPRRWHSAPTPTSHTLRSRALLTRCTGLDLFSARSKNRVIRRGTPQGDVVGDEEPAGQRRRAALASVPHGLKLRVPSSVRLRQLRGPVPGVVLVEHALALCAYAYLSHPALACACALHSAAFLLALPRTRACCSVRGPSSPPAGPASRSCSARGTWGRRCHCSTCRASPGAAAQRSAWPASCCQTRRWR